MLSLSTTERLVVVSVAFVYCDQRKTIHLHLCCCHTGVRVVDNPEENIYPMPLTASGRDAVDVGRIRQSLVFGEKGLSDCFFDPVNAWCQRQSSVAARSTQCYFLHVCVLMCVCAFICMCVVFSIVCVCIYMYVCCIFLCVHM